ncbi:aminotransferase [Candidatus Marinamargulisbacteria bacterium SCGC AAA071-K20]|nr:aminotransferase [Candidatus Marinamargulisbacteria bacterium SCGC AAA071-K20]
MNLSPFIRETAKSETLLINELSLKKVSEGETLYRFGFGQSPFLPPLHVIDGVKLRAHHKEYQSVQGLTELREAVATFHTEVDELDYSADQVVIGPGSKMLIYAVMASFKKANVFLVTPSWVSYEPQAILAGHPIYRINTSFENKWRLLPADLEKALSERENKEHPSLMILNYPGNPDGLTYSPEELKAIADVARKHNLLIISDEIYGLLNHKCEHHSIAKFYPEATIVTAGLSKWCGAGGWRLGVALFPKKSLIQNAVIGVASETYSCVSAPIAYAAIEAYNYDDRIKKYLTVQRQILSHLGNWIADELSTAGVSVCKPEGGFYVNPDFTPLKEKLSSRGITNSQNLCAALLDDINVVLLPGLAFGYADDNLVTRLAYVDFDGATILDGMLNGSIIVNESFIKEHTPKVHQGITALANWVRSL